MSEAYYADASVSLYYGDCLDVLAELPDASVDSVCTDPPYGLGFMGKAWDDLPPGIPFAAECLRVLKPGGHLLAFGGTRTSHRLACAIEDAGFEIRDSIAWLYGCLSDDTEILTSEGWVRYNRATEGQHALAFDTTTGDVEWQPIQHVHRYWHDGEMVRLHSEHTDQLLTPKHRVILDGAGRLPHVPQGVDTGDVRSVRGRVLEAERLAETDGGALLLAGVQRGATRSGMGDAGPQGKRGQDPRELRHGGSEDDRREQSCMEGRRYRFQEARELCRDQVRAGAGVGAPDGPQGRLHHGAPATGSGAVRLSDDPAGSGQPREPRPEGQPARESDAVAVEPGSQTLRVGPDGSRRVLPSTRFEATRVGYAGVVWCITVATGAFIARRNGLIFATGNSGFPKSLDVSKAIDKAAGAEREVIGAKVYAGGHVQRSSPDALAPPIGTFVRTQDRRDDTAPATPDAERWQGWGTALKPAHEPIVVARKPLSGTVAANVLTHGTGALNVDGCRTVTTDALGGGAATKGSASHAEGWDRPWKNDPEAVAAHASRVAANVVKAESLGRWPANVILDELQAAVLDEQSGVQRDGIAVNRNRAEDENRSWYGTRKSQTGEDVGYGGQGGASRFFYTAKADASERVRVGGIAHPTVKPLALMRWLVRLVTPPGGTVLEPFAGSGTTVEACILEGFRCIAIEREADYLPLVVQRIHRRRDPVAAVRGSGTDGGLFDLLDGGVA